MSTPNKLRSRCLIHIVVQEQNGVHNLKTQQARMKKIVRRLSPALVLSLISAGFTSAGVVDLVSGKPDVTDADLRLWLDAGDASTLKRQPFTGGIKTGTTHDFADGWCVGYNGAVTLGVWVGFHQGKKAIYENAFGRKLAFRPWSEVMNVAEESYPGVDMELPEGLSLAKICSESGLLATRYCYELVKDPGRGTSYRYTGQSELLRAARAKLGLCDTHGKGGIGTNEVLERYGPLAVESGDQRHLPVAPIVPTSSGLVGEDPYDSELVSLDESGGELSIFVRGPSLLLETEVQGDTDGGVLLHRPRKIEIKTD